jgi:hypothetical protein
VKCDGVKKLAMADTEHDGSFEVKLPSGTSKSSPLNCQAKLLGGPVQLYASRKNVISKIIKADQEPNSYTISTPLSFSTSCPAADHAKCKAAMNKVLPRLSTCLYHRSGALHHLAIIFLTFPSSASLDYLWQ